MSVTYAKVLGKHRINLVAGGNISSNKSLTQGYSALGFPDGRFFLSLIFERLPGKWNADILRDGVPLGERLFQHGVFF